MVYNPQLAQRVTRLLETESGICEKKMFGGIGYLLNGNMACGVLKDDLIVRVGPAAYEAALHQEHVRMFDITGRPMRGWVMISPEGHTTDSALAAWVQQGLNFAASLPEK